MKLTPVSEQTPYLKILVYGPPDSGKTTFASSGAKSEGLSITAVMNMENGLQSILSSGASQTPMIKSESDMESVITSMAGRSDEWEDVSVLVPDSLTEMQGIILNECVVKRMAKKGGPNKPQIGEFGDAMSGSERIFRMIRDLPCHVIATAHSKDHKEKKDGPVTHVRPRFIGQSWEAACGMFDCVWYMKKLPGVPASDDSEAKPERVAMITTHQGVYFSRTKNVRFGKLLPTMITNPTLPQIYEIFQESLMTHE